MREGSSASVPRTRSKAAKERREAEKVESIQWLDKLPREVWEKIFDNVDENDLFPLALSCRYFRQKQKELVARARESEPGIGKTPLALKTNLQQKLREGGPASADYLWFCKKEKVPENVRRYVSKPKIIRHLAAYHGHLPLLQKLQAGLKSFDWDISRNAGKYSTSQSLFLFLLLLGFGF